MSATALHAIIQYAGSRLKDPCKTLTERIYADSSTAQALIVYRRFGAYVMISDSVTTPSASSKLYHLSPPADIIGELAALPKDSRIHVHPRPVVFKDDQACANFDLHYSIGYDIFGAFSETSAESAAVRMALFISPVDSWVAALQEQINRDMWHAGVCVLYPGSTSGKMILLSDRSYSRGSSKGPWSEA